MTMELFSTTQGYYTRYETLNIDTNHVYTLQHYINNKVKFKMKHDGRCLEGIIHDCLLYEVVSSPLK